MAGRRVACHLRDGPCCSPRTFHNEAGTDHSEGQFPNVELEIERDRCSKESRQGTGATTRQLSLNPLMWVWWWGGEMR